MSTCRNLPVFFLTDLFRLRGGGRPGLQLKALKRLEGQGQSSHACGSNVQSSKSVEPLVRWVYRRVQTGLVWKPNHAILYVQVEQPCFWDGIRIHPGDLCRNRCLGNLHIIALQHYCSPFPVVQDSVLSSVIYSNYTIYQRKSTWEAFESDDGSTDAMGLIFRLMTLALQAEIQKIRALVEDIREFDHVGVGQACRCGCGCGCVPQRNWSINELRR